MLEVKPFLDRMSYLKSYSVKALNNSGAEIVDDQGLASFELKKSALKVSPAKISCELTALDNNFPELTFRNLGENDQYLILYKPGIGKQVNDLKKKYNKPIDDIKGLKDNLNKEGISYAHITSKKIKNNTFKMGFNGGELKTENGVSTPTGTVAFDNGPITNPKLEDFVVISTWGNLPKNLGCGKFSGLTAGYIDFNMDEKIARAREEASINYPEKMKEICSAGELSDLKDQYDKSIIRGENFVSLLNPYGAGLTKITSEYKKKSDAQKQYHELMAETVLKKTMENESEAKILLAALKRKAPHLNFGNVNLYNIGNGRSSCKNSSPHFLSLQQYYQNKTSATINNILDKTIDLNKEQFESLDLVLRQDSINQIVERINQTSHNYNKICDEDLKYSVSSWVGSHGMAYITLQNPQATDLDKVTACKYLEKIIPAKDNALKILGSTYTAVEFLGSYNPLTAKQTAGITALKIVGEVMMSYSVWNESKTQLNAMNNSGALTGTVLENEQKFHEMFLMNGFMLAIQASIPLAVPLLKNIFLKSGVQGVIKWISEAIAKKGILNISGKSINFSKQIPVLKEFLDLLVSAEMAKSLKVSAAFIISTKKAIKYLPKNIQDKILNAIKTKNPKFLNKFSQKNTCNSRLLVGAYSKEVAQDYMFNLIPLEQLGLAGFAVSLKEAMNNQGDENG